nr:uncharacterized protein LOC119165496 [Rhipicephalus microplus]
MRQNTIVVPPEIPAPSDFVSCLHVAMRCFCGVNKRVYVNDHPNRCPLLLNPMPVLQPLGWHRSTFWTSRFLRRHFVSCLHVAMRCFCGVNERVYVNDHPNRCPRCSTRCLCYNRLDGTVPPFGPADSFVDVGNRPSLYSKRSSDTCLLLFPGPSVIYDNVSECFHVLKLLLCGDIESNPGPDDKVLTAIASLSAKVDSRHAELLAVLNQVQTNQSLLEQKVTDLSSRLATVETMVESYDSGHHIPDLPQAVNTVIRNETTALHSRLDELEDRSRRDNLIFFGIADNVSEGWAQSEKIITDLISQKLDLNLSNEAIQRAHRLGAYVPNKCRPIIVKFQSSKIKDNVFYQRKKFQPSKVSVSEDFSRATRQCRKKLHEFGKNSGQPYSLRVNKLYINKTVYVYCHVTDRVCELETREERNNSNIGNASPVTLPAAASLPAPAT